LIVGKVGIDVFCLGAFLLALAFWSEPTLRIAGGAPNR
jgi:hypothetical protein